MINVNELKVGNWVNVGNVDIPRQIETIGIHSVTLIGNTGDYAIETFDPIELTPEILVKCGFDEWSDGHWKTRSSLNKNGWSKEFNYYQPYSNLSTYCGNVGIKYLHQLQNLYFSLTGEELNFQLSEPKVE